MTLLDWDPDSNFAFEEELDLVIWRHKGQLECHFSQEYKGDERRDCILATTSSSRSLGNRLNTHNNHIAPPTHFWHSQTVMDWRVSSNLEDEERWVTSSSSLWFICENVSLEVPMRNTSRYGIISDQMEVLAKIQMTATTRWENSKPNDESSSRSSSPSGNLDFGVSEIWVFRMFSNETLIPYIIGIVGFGGETTVEVDSEDDTGLEVIIFPIDRNPNIGKSRGYFWNVSFFFSSEHVTITCYNKSNKLLHCARPRVQFHHRSHRIV